MYCQGRIAEIGSDALDSPRIGTTGGSDDRLATAACHFISGKPDSVEATSNSLQPTGFAAGRNSCEIINL